MTTGERCAWCGAPAFEQVETQPGSYKTTSDPNTGRTAKICTRLPVLAWACGRHRGLTLDEPFRALRSVKADVEQERLL